MIQHPCLQAFSTSYLRNYDPGFGKVRNLASSTVISLAFSGLIFAITSANFLSFMRSQYGRWRRDWSWWDHLSYTRRHYYPNSTKRKFGNLWTPGIKGKLRVAWGDDHRRHSSRRYRLHQYSFTRQNCWNARCLWWAENTLRSTAASLRNTSYRHTVPVLIPNTDWNNLGPMGLPSALFLCG